MACDLPDAAACDKLVPAVIKEGDARGAKGEPETSLTPEQIAFAQITQGIHW